MAVKHCSRANGEDWGELPVRKNAKLWRECGTAEKTTTNKQTIKNNTSESDPRSYELLEPQNFFWALFVTAMRMTFICILYPQSTHMIFIIYTSIINKYINI